ncbi:unnamed protein product [Pleuronectes platessa]|uniref:Uncharacterized protein n=1 Tax=Pleuronectes platessa TaxID=8262 RepID=A0A9N7Y2K5_PLEPL|nr:unnamed protein product [Pleuronectes platessa]
MKHPHLKPSCGGGTISQINQLKVHTWLKVIPNTKDAKRGQTGRVKPSTVQLDWHSPENTRTGRSATGALSSSQMRAGSHRAHVTGVNESHSAACDIIQHDQFGVGPEFLLVQSRDRPHVAREWRQFLDEEATEAND